ncbi:MAG: 5-formyltetrahydrofolate cyclo-ligase [Planctomycetota bacterium]|nr:5-formyltetrahydrofolate cyclo-ligase [Planctomycetota bacterium]
MRPDRQETNTKLRVRREARRVLAALTPVERKLRSSSACVRLADTPGFAGAKTLMLYIPTAEEVDISSLVGIAVRAGKRVCMPRMDWSARTMEPVLVSGPGFSSEVRKHGVPEPTPGPVATLDLIDLVIVPGLAFDTQGRRMGRGGGFYDRFLAAYRTARPRGGAALGICFEAQLVPEIPTEPHDAQVDGLVTESRILLCRQKPSTTDTV